MKICEDKCDVAYKNESEEREMSKKWDYAKMSHEAALAGGPEKWIEIIKRDSYNVGASDMKNLLVVPLLTASMGLGALCTIGCQKIHGRIAEKKRNQLVTAQEAAKAEEYLKNELSECKNEMESNDGCKEE